MRSYFAATLMGIGGILLSFAGVVFVLEIFASRSDSGHRLAGMTALGVGCAATGGVLLAAGALLDRVGRARGHTSTQARRSA